VQAAVATKLTWAGDYAYDVRYFPESAVFKTMTAIVRTWTPQGFALVADGRSRREGVIRTETAQKIFPLESPIGSFAYSISGTAELFIGDSEEVLVSLAGEIQRSAESLRGRRTSNLTGYAVRLVRPAYKALNDVWESINPQTLPSQPSLPGERGYTILRLSLDGYHGEYPASVSVRMFHENGRLRELEVLPERLPLGFHMAAAPAPMIGRILWQDVNDPRLSAYKGRLVFAEDMTISDALERSRLFIQAHSDPEAIALDPNCLEVGGHIHIATITPSEGFKWIIEPIFVNVP
jgi:hypothetical protein